MKLINPEVRIENTNFCNSRCIMCPRADMTRKLAVMPFSHFTKLVYQAKQLGAKTISIFGYGEPLLDTDILAKVGFCKRQRLETFITTNGSLLDSDLAFRLLEAGLGHIRFSVHGIFSKEFERVHRGLDWITVLRNIFNFIVVNRKRFDGRCATSVTVIPMFGESISDIRRFWEPHVDWLEIWKPHGWGGARDYRKPTNTRLDSCARPFTGPIQIQADGKIIPCCFLTNGEIILGDTYTNTIEEVLRGEPYEELRERHRQAQLVGLPCETCDQLNVENESPLLFSTRDPDKKLGCTSSTKFCL